MEGQKFRNVAAASHLPLGFLQQSEYNLHQEGGLCFPAVCLTYLNSLLGIYIGLGFCSTHYVCFLGVAAPGIENNRQNTEAVNP